MRFYRKLLYTAYAVILLAIQTGCAINQSSQFSSSSDDIEKWVGVYSFTEFAEPDINMFYRIDIYKENSEYFADINIDGFQTITRISAKVQGNQDSIKLVFESYLPDNLSEPYNKGDILLGLNSEDATLYTNWGILKPMIAANNDAEKVCFNKAE